MAEKKPVLEKTKHIGNLTVKGNGEFPPKAGSRIAQEFVITTGDNKQYLATINHHTHVHDFDGNRAKGEVKNPPKEVKDFIATQKKNYDDFMKKK